MRTRTKLATAAAACFAITAGFSTFALHKGFSARDEPSFPERLAARTARSMAVPRSAAGLKNPFTTKVEDMAEARANWAQNCALCHGANGDGKTEIGRNLYPKPPDLRAAATQKQSDGELYLTIQNGIRLTGMPSWGEIRDDDHDRWNLVELIRTLPRLTPEDIKEIEQFLPKSSDAVPVAASGSDTTVQSQLKKSTKRGNKSASRQFP